MLTLPLLAAAILAAAPADTVWWRSDAGTVIGHHSSGGLTCTLTLDGGAPDEVRLVLHNHGAIPPTELPGILAPFRASTSSDKARGLGLGLFITAHIARLHGGRLEVASDEAEGTTFTLTLPRHPPAG